jgi:hypothetical protein
MTIVGRRVSVSIYGGQYIGIVEAIETVRVTLDDGASVTVAGDDITLLCAYAGCPNPADGSGIYCSECWVDPGETA